MHYLDRQISSPKTVQACFDGSLWAGNNYTWWKEDYSLGLTLQNSYQYKFIIKFKPVVTKFCL